MPPKIDWILLSFYATALVGIATRDLQLTSYILGFTGLVWICESS